MSSSADYWRKRSEDRFKAAERTVESQQEDLTHFFDDALKDTQVVIRDFWARYAKDNKISYAEAQKLLNLEELREFKGDLKAFEKLAKSSIGTFNLELENLSTKSRITRYQALETQLKAVMENLTGKTEKMIQDTAGKVCEDSFYRTLFDIDQYRGFHEDFVGIDENLIREIISQPVAGATFSQSIWRNQQNLNYRVRQTLTEAMATGRNPYELSKEFAKEFNVGRYEAYRLLYTESAAVHTDAQMRAYKADGVKQYEIVATLDSKTSKICQEMDGKLFDVDKAQKGENCPPFHPWCRTTTAPVTEGLEETWTRAARSKTTGKTEKIPAGMKYKDWKEKYGGLHSKVKGLTGNLQNSKKSTQNFKSTVDLENYAKNNLGINNVDFSGLDFNSTEKVVNALDSIFQSYPQLNGKITEIKQSTNGFMAASPSADLSSYTFSLNPNLFADPRRLQRTLNYQVKKAFYHPSTTVESIVYHEIGHVLEGEYIRSTTTDTKVMEWLWNSSQAATNVLELASMQCYSDTDKWKTLYSLISDYSKDSPSEMLAECVGLELSGHGFEFTKEVLKILTGVI